MADFEIILADGEPGPDRTGAGGSAENGQDGSRSECFLGFETQAPTDGGNGGDGDNGQAGGNGGNCGTSEGSNLQLGRITGDYEILLNTGRGGNGGGGSDGQNGGDGGDGGTNDCFFGVQGDGG